MDEEIKNNIVSDFNVEFYFDFNKHDNTICDLKFVYNDDNGKKFILPDKNKEKEIANILISYGFFKEHMVYVFRDNDLNLYNFLNEGILKLKEIGEVYHIILINLNRKDYYSSSSIKANIKSGIDGYLEFDFNIDDINKDEYKDILTAFKKKKVSSLQVP